MYRYCECQEYDGFEKRYIYSLEQTVILKI